MENKNLNLNKNKIYYFSSDNEKVLPSCFVYVQNEEEDFVTLLPIDCEENKEVPKVSFKRKKDKLILIEGLFFRNKYYKNFLELFQEKSIITRNGKLLNLSCLLGNYIGSFTVEQNNNQEDKDSFILFISFKQRKIVQIVSSKDIFDIVKRLVNVSHTAKNIEHLIDLFIDKEKLLLEDFCSNNLKIVKDALSYRLLGLIQNKIKREEVTLLFELFKKLNLKVEGFDKNGNMIYSEYTDL